MNAFLGHTTMTQMSKTNNIKTHPSVRIRGTENNYNPVQCFDPSCTNKNPHMHCPFCVKAESFQDPIILKAHYRVKHVDKGVEFAGLKILRCCDHCDIVGIIKGEKKFKRAHWHCYKCRNGFNRRDEAIKHYKTHFRNPQTTFQIQISQEVNQVNHLAGTHTMSQDEVTIHPVLADAAILSSSSSNSGQHTLVTRTTPNHLTNGKSNDGTVHVSVAANETVDTSESQTIMIIKDDLSNLNNSLATQIISSGGVSILEDKLTSEKQYALLQDKYDQLALEKAQMEQDYKVEIDHLKLQIQILSRDTTNYQKREQELLSRLCPTSDKSISDMVRQMEEQYRNLLDCHLAQLRSTYLSNLPAIRCEETSSANASCTSDSTSTVTAVRADSLIAEPPLLGTHQTDLNGMVDYQATAIAASIEQQQEAEPTRTVDTGDLHQQRQEHLAYISNKVVARLQVADSHDGQVHDDIVIITSSDEHHVQQSQEEGTGSNEPLIICTSTVEEATLEETVSCHTGDPADETVVSEGDLLDGTVKRGCDSAESDAQVQVLSIIHASAEEDVAATTATDDAADDDDDADDDGQQNIDAELPPSKRLRTDS